MSNKKGREVVTDGKGADSQRDMSRFPTRYELIHNGK